MPIGRHFVLYLRFTRLDLRAAMGSFSSIFDIESRRWAQMLVRVKSHSCTNAVRDTQYVSKAPKASDSR